MYTTGAQPTPVVDRMSSARRLTDEELRAWAHTQAVFISSVMTGLATERRLLASMIAELGATPVLFEDFGGRDQGAQEAYLAGVARSDIYVGVIGDRYGAITPTGRSATHQEYREAVRLDKRISVWVRDHGANRQGDARDFVDEVRVFHTTGSFTDPEDLVRRAGSGWSTSPPRTWRPGSSWVRWCSAPTASPTAEARCGWRRRCGTRRLPRR